MNKFLALASIMILAGCTPPTPSPVVPSPTPAATNPAVPSSPSDIPGFQKDWSAVAKAELKAHLMELNHASLDMKRFCPNYPILDEVGQVNAWGYLISSIVSFESGYKLSDAMTESNGAVSQGLFQLTYGDSHCPKSKAEANLNDAAVNIKCAIAIMADETAKDGLVASGGYEAYGASPPKGLARYWSVIRVPDPKPHLNSKGAKVQSVHHLSDIMAATAKAPGCR